MKPDNETEETEMQYSQEKQKQYLAHRKTKTQLEASERVGISLATAARWDAAERQRVKGGSKSARTSAGYVATALAAMTNSPGTVTRVVPASTLYPELPVKLEVKGRIILDVRTATECELVKACLANALVL